MEVSQNKVAKVVLEYQPVLWTPPVPPTQLYQNACSNDARTIDHWREKWISNIKANKARFGSFKEHSAGKLFGAHKHKPTILAGSGPSLKRNAHLLKDRKGITLVSCLHNFHYFEDLDLAPDYYCTLDAGEVTIEEVTEGGTKSEEEYWARTKDRKLVAYIGSSPKLLAKWQGEIYLFNAPTPDQSLTKEIDEIEKFNLYFSNGGNVLGACLYLAKAILGSATIIYVGADFSFGYPEIEENNAQFRFHSWKSKYDEKMGKTQRVTDVYGNKVHTWPSYYNFKHFFDWVSLNVPGDYINSSEGGCLGAYDSGNLFSFRYMDLKDSLKFFSLSDELAEACINPEVDYKKILY